MTLAQKGVKSFRESAVVRPKTQKKEKIKMNKKQYDVNSFVNGRKVREFEKDGMTFIEGREGTKYEINISNNSSQRILAVVTVDGYSVLGDNQEDNSGYIINGHDSLKLKGFRTSEDKVSSFVFAAKGESRAQKRFGYAKNCGVIGVKIYKEKEDYAKKFFEKFADIEKNRNQNPWIWPQHPTYPNVPIFTCDVDKNVNYKSQDTTTNYNLKHQPSTVSCALRANTFDLGTKMGEELSSPIKYVDFEVGELDATFEIYYATKESLKRNNITEKPKQQVYIPRAFCKKV